MKRTFGPASRATGLERELMGLIRDVMPQAVAEGDEMRVDTLERQLAQAGMAYPNAVSSLWNAPEDVPRNEVQVREMYGTRMPEFGYRVAASQEAFPDWCLQDLKSGKFLYAEVEHKSASFYTHDHDQTLCDMIVCWEHNTSNLCVPVIELLTGALFKPKNPIDNARVDHEKRARSFGRYAHARFFKKQTDKPHKDRDPMETARMIVSAVDSMVDTKMPKREAVREVAQLYGMGRSTVWAILKKRGDFGI